MLTIFWGPRNRLFCVSLWVCLNQPITASCSLLSVGEFGDYDPNDHPTGYLDDFPLLDDEVLTTSNVQMISNGSWTSFDCVCVFFCHAFRTLTSLIKFIDFTSKQSKEWTWCNQWPVKIQLLSTGHHLFLWLSSLFAFWYCVVRLLLKNGEGVSDDFTSVCVHAVFPGVKPTLLLSR